MVEDLSNIVEALGLILSITKIKHRETEKKGDKHTLEISKMSVNLHKIFSEMLYLLSWLLVLHIPSLFSTKVL